jgi:hypothetical protein
LLVADADDQLPDLPEQLQVTPKFCKEGITSWLTHKMGAEAFGQIGGKDLDSIIGGWGDGTLDPKQFKMPQATEAAQLLQGASRAEYLMIYHLEQKDAFALAKALKPLTGDVVANTIFGIGVLGMALSTITLLMLVSGFVICEILGLPPGGWPNRLGMLAATVGVIGPFWAGDVLFYLAVPTSVFGMMLLPFAYLTFFFVMNSKSLLGENMPRGGRRVAWNLAMGVAALAATAASLFAIWLKAGHMGLYAAAGLAALVVIVHFVFPRKPTSSS